MTYLDELKLRGRSPSPLAEFSHALIEIHALETFARAQIRRVPAAGEGGKALHHGEHHRVARLGWSHDDRADRGGTSAHGGSCG
jgi:hypothetical protein